MNESMNRPFTEEKTEMANKHMTRCSISLVSEEMQNKTTIRGHCTPTQWAKSQKPENAKH